jgi:SPP1 family predicted phage head-tail adaptor
MSCFNFASLAKNRIEIQSQSDTVDDVGGVSRTWTTVNTVWAILEPKSGKETLKYEQLESTISMVVTIRYISSLSNTQTGAKYRIKFGDRLFKVLAVMNLEETLKIEGKSFQKLICTEGEVIA